MKTIAWLGLGSALLFAACGDTETLRQPGRGGNGGAAGNAGGRGGSPSAGTSGRGGAGGGTAGVGGSGGDGGSAGRGGNSGTGIGGSGTGVGGSGTDGGTGGASDGGSDAPLCEQGSCKRPYQCVQACGGPVEYTGCCPCVAPLFDDYGGAACGDGGQGAVSYVGCRFVGGYDRVVVGKRDTRRNLCFNLVLFDSPGQATAGLTLPTPFRLEWSTVGPASACPSRVPQSAQASQTAGTVTEVDGGLGTPNAVTVDVTMTFPANDAGAPPAERLSAQNVDVQSACP